MLSELQKAKFVHQFRVMDTDGNGYIEWSDYERIANRIQAVRGPDAIGPKHDDLVAQYRFAWEEARPYRDERGIGVEQWLAHQQALLSSPEMYDTVVRQTAEMIFDTFDLDGDNQVSPDEWRAFFRCYGIDEALVDSCFPAYDADGDGYVSRGELVKLVGEFFLSSDPEAPGNLLFGPWD